MRFGTPIFSMFSIASGNAASDDAVEKAMRYGSLTYFQNSLIGTRAINATGTSATSTNTISAP